tara:strand:+ start:12591 stop:20654 length:8064 start_codon:yes stop_codon:yes gene_type:complete
VINKGEIVTDFYTSHFLKPTTSKYVSISRRWHCALIISFSILTAFGPQAEAAESSPEKQFGKLDRNSDSKVSLEEYLTGKENDLQRRRLFFQYDVDEDSTLSEKELQIKTPPQKLTPLNHFRYLDQNADETLSLKEYVSGMSSSKPALSKRDFKVCDIDGNGKLTLVEFQTITGIVPAGERSAIPDPVAELASSAKEKWQIIQKAADANSDNRLSKTEWPEEELRKQIPALADLSFAIWDADQDGQVSSQEAELLLDVAYGIRHVDGSTLRAPNGWVFYRSYFIRTDKDHDHRLSKEEYLPSIRWPEEKVLSLFQKLDVDKDEFLTIPELTKTTTSYIDEFAYFLRSDLDLDGLLSREELLKIGVNGATELRLAHVLPAFDMDGDEKLSLSEFRLAPIGCGYVTLQVYDREDTNHDARLSWEEFYTESSPQLIGLAWELFSRFDQNKNGHLELSEFSFKFDPTKLSPEKAFAACDQNSDQELSQDEYLLMVSKIDQKVAKRNFRVVDFDGNGKLSLKEFQTLPGLFTPETRGVVPDPVAELAMAAHQTWQKIQKSADKNADGQLSPEEWPKADLKKQFLPLSDLKFSIWDEDQNGQVTRQEAAKLIDVAYGMKHFNGFPLRSTNGKVLYRFYIDRTDKNGDHRLSQAEYLPSISLPEEQVLERFQGIDKDEDGFLTFQEMTRSRTTNIDEFEYFLSRDSDLDGLLSSEELLKFNSNNITPQRLPQGMAAFDTDGDGKFSLSEFRLAPVGILYVTLRIYDRKDQDHDAKLSWQEFYAEPSPLLIGLAWELFKRFDQNNNGELELNEFEFQVDPTQLSSENAFAACDRNNDSELTLEEYRPLVPQLNPKLAERNFQVVDYDGNKRLSFAEYQTLPDLFAPEKRGTVPDPVAELAMSAHQIWQNIQTAADKNSDGQLSQEEWPAAELQKKLPPLAALKFKAWDTDQNGQVTSEEAGLLLDIAYGMRHVTGDPLRTPNGLVLYRSYFNNADKNGDNQLSKQEYLPSIRWPEEKVLTLFNELDTDKNEFLSLPELSKTTLSNIDEFNLFLRYDKDLDGFLSPEELAKVNSNDSNKFRLPQGLAAFDTDGDGKFSLREFRMAPMGCSYVTLRVYGRRDQDFDGTLSWEEFYQEPSPQMIGLAWELFSRFDRNKNGQLELNEFEYQVDPGKMSPKTAFAIYDQNSDAELSIDEYLTAFSTSKPDLAKRDFYVCDFDKNGHLSLAEYQTLPALFTQIDRGSVPDPVSELAQAARQKWQRIQKAADMNVDGQLSEKEWPLNELQQQLPPLAGLNFKAWDADQNGQVSADESDLLIDIAYGMKHVNGFPLRATNGMVLYRFYIERTDKNGDHRLSQEEYLPSIKLPEEQVLERFQGIDGNKDGFLSLQELTTSRTTYIDEFNYFLSSDKNLDGFLDKEELLKIGSNNATPLRLSHAMTAFDRDGDGKYSLEEFRLSPVGSSYVTFRVYDRKDLDYDARLSWQEFYAEPTPQLIGLAWELFHRFDHNQNGYLESNEFEFQIDPTKLSPERAFTACDKNKDEELDLEEYLPLVAKISPKQAKRNFQVVDYDGNKKLSLAEFQTLPELFKPEERGAVPDPVADLAKNAHQTWENIVKVADQNNDSMISTDEWPLEELKKQLTPLADLKFSVWDADQNGQVSDKESQLLIDIAYGIKHIDGSDLRADNGWVVYRSYFTNVDKDHDQRLSKKEYLPSIRWPEEKVLALFHELDTDKDEFLTIPELKKSTTSFIDELTFFLRTDKDLDGLLDADELGTVNSNERNPQRLAQGITAFDTDGDGKLSLQEFRLAPVGCFYVTQHLYNQKDQNHDAKLSWQEFYTEPSPQLIGLLWELFRRFDRNQNGQLELDEYDFQFEPTKLSPEHAFAVSDKNKDQELDLEEYLPLVSKINSKVAKRNFQVVDYDGNKKLSLAEYQTLPHLFAPENRGAVPDPVAELAIKAHQTWHKIQKTADQNKDSMISKDEWPVKELQKQLTPLSDLKFSVWDADQNGQVSEKEAQLLIDIAYGMKHVDGSSLRSKNGKVLYRFYITRTDKDGDHRLSKEEFLPSIRLPQEQVLALFQGMDADNDGFLTFQEMTTSSKTNIDEFNYFLSRDSDLDGFLSSEELLKFNSNNITPLRLPQGITAFDSDGDGKFSLREFRLAPIGILYVTLRVYDRRDLDHDAKLSWQEFYVEPSPQLIGLAWELFSRFDRDHSGQLDLDEFEFRIDSSKMSPEKAFAACDKDQSKTLSLDEYLSTVSQSNLRAAERDFKLVDFDKNGQLSLPEYQTLPDLLPPEKRGPVPDPVAILAKSALQTWSKIRESADTNSDGQLSSHEWPQSQLQQQLPPLAEVKFRVWDTDNNGVVDIQEAEKLIDIAYGMKHVTGAPLRNPNGLVLYRSYITHADKDGDNQLSKEEYLPSIRWPEEKVLALFKELDTDKNEFLSYKELAKSSLSNIDELKFFQRSDTDLDGLLSAEELAKVNSNDSTKERVPHGVAAFDADGDGHFSLQEFRLSPMGCNYVTMRVYGRQDKDDDGQLSWQEFYVEPSPQLIGLSWELFHRFDRNQNGQLDIDEFEFRYNPAKLPPEKHFAVIDLDGNGKLTFSEIFTDKVPDEKNVVAYRGYQIRQARAEDKFIQDDLNQDRALDLEEYIQARKAAQLIAERHRQAVGRTTADDGSKWLFPVMVTLNVLLLIGVGAFFLVRSKAN